jgi:hypothetical protein
MPFDQLKRREFMTLLGGAAALPLAARAQRLEKAFQVGVLYPGGQAAMPSRVASIQSGLRAGGLRIEQFEITPQRSVRCSEPNLQLNGEACVYWS